MLEAARIQSGATVVLIADEDRQVISTTNPTVLRSTLDLPEDTAWAGRGWDGDLNLAGRQLIAATVPIFSDSGALLGWQW